MSRGEEKISIAISGFEPFRRGSTVNAAYSLATSIYNQFKNSEDLTLKLVQVPVVWGEPRKAVSVNSGDIDFCIAFGEGTQFLRIEKRGSNRKCGSPDNKGNLSQTQENIEEIISSFDVLAFQKVMQRNGLEVKISVDAGQYLCEELCYALLKKQDSFQSVFVHVPITDRRILVNGKTENFSGEVMDEVARQVFESLLEVLKSKDMKES